MLHIQQDKPESVDTANYRNYPFNLKWQFSLAIPMLRRTIQIHYDQISMTQFEHIHTYTQTYLGLVNLREKQ